MISDAPIVEVSCYTDTIPLLDADGIKKLKDIRVVVCTYPDELGNEMMFIHEDGHLERVIIDEE